VLPDAPGLKANGEKTIPEDIADLGGMELAYQCYNNYLDKNGFKGEQKQLQLKRFFYAYAQEFRSKYTRGYIDYNAFGINKQDGPDVHSMNKERVNGIVTNCDGWYETFGITSGKLYRKPAERVHIW
jgi:predicted metalloendopeptidase